MPVSIVASHTITVPVPVAQCQMLFTAAGEELWIDEWKPRYIEPADGTTQQGMVFTTGRGAELTVWTLVDFDRTRHYTRFSRVTPALRAGTVEVHCRAARARQTRVSVSYRLTALTAAGEASLAAYAPSAFTQMLESWRERIEQRLPQLHAATIR
jgi:hypothetical protein